MYVWSRAKQWEYCEIVKVMMCGQRMDTLSHWIIVPTRDSNIRVILVTKSKELDVSG